MDKPLVSVIITTYNEEENISRLLKSIQRQSYSNLEMIVVDNYSKDKTKAMASRFTPHIYEASGERSRQRNFGARNSSGYFYIFLDADMELEKDLINEAVGLFQNNNYAALIIPEKSEGDGFWARVKALEKECYLGDPLMEAPRFFEKKSFWKIGGFDENLIASEDWDIANRFKKADLKKGRTSQKIIHHEGKLSLKEAVRKKFYYGKNLPLYLKKNPGLAFSQYQPFRPAFFKSWRKLLSQPMIALGLFFLKFCEYSAGALGIIKSQLIKK